MKIETKTFDGNPKQVIGLEEDSFGCKDMSDPERGTLGYAMIYRGENFDSRIFISSWRAWLRFLADELKSELYENMPQEYFGKFFSDFDDIQKFINIAVAGEDRFLLDEQIGNEKDNEEATTKCQTKHKAK